jgi:ribosomal protein L22
VADEKKTPGAGDAEKPARTRAATTAKKPVAKAAGAEAKTTRARGAAAKAAGVEEAKPTRARRAAAKPVAESAAEAKPTRAKAASAKPAAKAAAEAKPTRARAAASKPAAKPAAKAAATAAGAEVEEFATPVRTAAAAKAPARKQPAKRAAAAAPVRAPARQPRPVGPVTVRAQARYVHSSARKARLVCNHIRGKSVPEAQALLGFAPRGVAEAWAKLLASAVANAEHNHELIGDQLHVTGVYADEGPTLKRFRPRAMGRATPIHKRTSHLTIMLGPKE